MASKTSGLAFVFAAAVSSSPLLSAAADAHVRHRGHAASHVHRRYASAPHIIQCVAFARTASDVALSGNAADWWYNAAGVYARGQTPEQGSILNFRATGRMPYGHVAVVKDVLDPRTVMIDQSHWGRAGVSRDVRVIDVSAENDWSEVRVELGHEGSFGSIYPTYGFIYARPANGTDVTVARNTTRARHEVSLEVAEAPAVPTRSIDLSTGTITDDAPDRGLR